MTDLQLKIMEYSDKTLSFGCRVIIADYAYNDKQWQMYWWYRNATIWNEKLQDNYILQDWFISRFVVTSIIWHPYWFERLMYLQRSNELNVYAIGSRLRIQKYIDDNQELLTKHCIDRPEEGQKLVLQFLETLPKN